jgi:hypothetical protein
MWQNINSQENLNAEVRSFINNDTFQLFAAEELQNEYEDLEDVKDESDEEEKEDPFPKLAQVWPPEPTVDDVIENLCGKKRSMTEMLGLDSELVINL